MVSHKDYSLSCPVGASYVDLFGVYWSLFVYLNSKVSNGFKIYTSFCKISTTSESEIPRYLIVTVGFP